MEMSLVVYVQNRHDFSFEIYWPLSNDHDVDGNLSGFRLHASNDFVDSVVYW